MIQCLNPLPRSAVGKGPFPGVLLLPGSGAVDMNETAGHIRIDNKTGSKIYPAAQPLFQIAEYMSDRAFVVLRYDKTGVGSNYTFSDSNAWDNLTFDNLKQDAEKALSADPHSHNFSSTVSVFSCSSPTTNAVAVAILLDNNT